MASTTAADLSPPGSPLSEHGSDEFDDDVKLDNNARDDLDDDLSDPDPDPDSDVDLPTMPPAKKLRTGGGGGGIGYIRATPPLPGEMTDGEISSDTEGEAPSSPGGAQGPAQGVAGPGQDEELEQQVTVCRWRACAVGDLGNMDELVRHIHDVHIGSRQKKYACEWEGCSRMDATHASGYALRAHMRSHTREKPFYCALPECDKSFTRSDALAKHMRTVHETEALRPSDPVPRYHSSLASKQPKLKLVFGKGKPDGGGSGAASSNGAAGSQAGGELPIDWVIHNPGYPAWCNFDEEESAMAPDKLYTRLKLLASFADEENEELKAECERLEKTRHEEWKRKELVLLNVIEGTLAVEVQTGVEEGSEMVDGERAGEIVAAMLPEYHLPMSREELVFWRHMEDASVGSVETGGHAAAAAVAVQNGVKTEMDVDKS